MGKIGRAGISLYTWIDWNKVDFGLAAGLREVLIDKIWSDEKIAHEYDTSYPVAMDALSMPFKDIPIRISEVNKKDRTELFRSILRYRLEVGR